MTYCLSISVIALVFAANPIMAQKAEEEELNADKEQQAKEKFKKGVVFFKQKKFEEALVEFEASFEIKPKLSVLFNIAMCQRKMYRYDESIKAFQKYLAESKELKEKVRKKIQDLIEEMEMKAARLMVVTHPDGVELIIDNRIKLKTPLSAPVFLGPGEHTIEAGKKGYEAISQHLVLVEGLEKIIELRLEKEGKKPSTAKATIEVYCEEREATSSIEGGESKSLPADFLVEPGKYKLYIEAPGMIPEIREVHVDPGEKIRVDVSLKPMKALEDKGKHKGKKPFYKTAWFWSILGGAVVAGAGVGIYFGVAGGGDDRDIIQEVYLP